MRDLQAHITLRKALCEEGLSQGSRDFTLTDSPSLSSRFPLPCQPLLFAAGYFISVDLILAWKDACLQTFVETQGSVRFCGCKATADHEEVGRKSVGQKGETLRPQFTLPRSSIPTKKLLKTWISSEVKGALKFLL